MAKKFTFSGSSAVADKPKNPKVKKEKVKAEEIVVEQFPKGLRYEARCMKDQEAVVVSEGRLVNINGRLAVRGIHKKCGTTVFAFTSQTKYDDAKKKGKKK